MSNNDYFSIHYCYLLNNVWKKFKKRTHQETTVRRGREVQAAAVAVFKTRVGQFRGNNVFSGRVENRVQLSTIKICKR